MIDLGSVVQIAVDVRDADGVLTDPGTAALTITLPDGTTTSPGVPLPSSTAGEVRVDYVTVQAGRHIWRLVTTSPVTAYADTFDVQDGEPDGIVSLARTKRHLGIDPTDTSEDEDLRAWIASATDAIEKHLGRAVARRTVTERCTPDRYGQFLLSTLPVFALVAVTTPDGSQTWDTGDLDVDATGTVTAIAGPALSRTVDVTYQAGPAAIPDGEQQAALIIVQHMWETRRGAMGVQLGGEGETWNPGRGYSIPRRAIELLDSNLPGVA
ncbi:head-tail connector protein [Streptomyces antibioticus]|uniref:head-tail connector protein n=1 Tax=Streptomyces antibioticus TaxID=1890 RepID=UPI0033E3D52B